MDLFFFSRLQIIIVLFEHGHYSSLDFLQSLVPGVVKWIDHNPIFLAPYQEPDAKLSCLRQYYYVSPSVFLHSPLHAIPPAKNLL